jgi:L-asparaginase II
MAEPSANPPMIATTRGRRIESMHRGAAAVVTCGGSLVAAWGDVDRPVFVRSAAKPLQALALVETGAADAFSVSAAELALACGSHGGEPVHVAFVKAWLGRIGVGKDSLVCGPHPPLDTAAARALVRSGEPEGRLHNNCSGKHAGFVTTVRHLNLPLAGYGDIGHPLQARIRRTIAEIGDVEIGNDRVAVDGCGVPVFALPLRALARAFARLADPAALSSARANAARRVLAAMAAHPEMVAGQDRFETSVIAAGAGTIIVKGGAEGVQAAALPGLGIGIAVKIDDGAKRAAEAAMATLLLAFAEPAPLARHRLAGYRTQPLCNTADALVGEIRPCAGWPGR